LAKKENKPMDFTSSALTTNGLNYQRLLAGETMGDKGYDRK
jgi:hypothetical protein